MTGEEAVLRACALALTHGLISLPEWHLAADWLEKHLVDEESGA